MILGNDGIGYCTIFLKSIVLQKFSEFYIVL